MEIAILVFFFAIFGGVLFLLALIWFVFRRIRNSRSGSRNFSDSSSGYIPAQSSFIDSDDDSDAIYAANSTVSESPVLTETAHDSPHQSDNTYSPESHSASAAPAD